MAADAPYFDTSYLVRLYLGDPGFESVRQLAGTATTVASAWHAQAETVAAFHRAFREGRLQRDAYLVVLEQFTSDSQAGMFQWLPLTESIQRRLEQGFRDATSPIFLRAADALHLACAAGHSWKTVYSNDRHLLAAAPLFGLQGTDLIGKGKAPL